MRKDESLRAAIVAQLPELSRDAQALKVWLGKGTIAAVAGVGAGWEYRYDLSLLLIDFAANPDLVFYALLEWVRVEQPDLLLSPGALDKTLSFEVEVIDDKTVDILITIKVSESVRGIARPEGIELVHLESPQLDDNDLLAPGALLSSIVPVSDG